MAFVIIFLSPFLSFSGTVHVPVNQALSRDKEMKKPLPLAPHFSAIIPCKHLAVAQVLTAVNRPCNRGTQDRSAWRPCSTREPRSLLPFSYSNVCKHPRAVSCSCFIADCQSTGTFGSALPFRSHTGSTGTFTSSVVATTQDGQL